MSIEPKGTSANLSFTTKWWTAQLAGPVIAAAVVRLALVILLIARNGANALFEADTLSYLEPGRNLLLHGRFFSDGVPDLVRTPGYSLFLAVTSLAGMPAAAIANVILSVFCVILVWRLGRTVFEEDRIALAAAWIFALEPISIIYSGTLMSETLFITLFLLSLERLAEFLRTRRLQTLAAAGLWLAAATLVRPVAYYLPLALALGLFLVFARAPGFPPQQRRTIAGGIGLRWKAPAVLLLSVIPWLAAWQIRNRIETGYSGFTSISDVNLYFNSAADVTARLKHSNWADVRHEFGYFDFSGLSRGQIYLYQPYLSAHSEQAGWNQVQRIAFMHSEAVSIIRAHPGIYLRSSLAALFKTVFDPGAGSLDAMLSPGDPKQISGLILKKGFAGAIELVERYPWELALKAALEIVVLGLFVFAGRGVYRSGIHNARFWLLLGTSLYLLVLPAAVMGPVADSRLRMPVMPAICILAAAGIQRPRTIVKL